MLRFLLPIAFFSVTSAFAQMTLPSVFPDMKSINPAVISLRKQGQIKVAGQHDKIKKEQEVLQPDGSTVAYNEKNDIELNNMNFFRAGKGGGLTSEFHFDYTTGSKDTYNCLRFMLLDKASSWNFFLKTRLIFHRLNSY